MDIIDICICEELWSRWVSWEQGQLILGDRVVCNSIDRHLIPSIYLIACPLYRYPVDPAFSAIPDRTGSIRGSDWSAGNHADTIFLLPTHHDATHGRDCPLCHSDMVVQLTGVSLVLQQSKAQGKAVDKWMKQSNRQTNKQTSHSVALFLSARQIIPAQISAYLILFILNSRMGTFSDSCIFHGMLRWWSQTWVGPTAFRVLPRHQQTLRCIPSECLWLQISTDTSCDIHVFGQCVRNISEEAHRNTFCVHSDNLCIISCTFCAIVIVHLTYWVISNLLQNLSRMWLVSGSLASRDADIKACYLVSGDCCCTLCIGQVDQLFNGILLRFKRGNPCKQPMPWRSLVWTPRLVTGLRAYTSNMLGRRVQSHLKPHLPTSNSHHCTTGMATNCPVNWKYHRSIKRWQLCSKSLMFPGFLDTWISLTAQHPEDRVLKTRRRVIMMGLLQYTFMRTVTSHII